MDRQLLPLTNGCRSVVVCQHTNFMAALGGASPTWMWWKTALQGGWSQNHRQPGWWSWALEVGASSFSYNILTAPYHCPAMMWHLEEMRADSCNWLRERTGLVSQRCFRLICTALIWLTNFKTNTISSFSPGKLRSKTNVTMATL